MHFIAHFATGSGNFFLLSLGYSLAWFLFCTLLYIVTGGRTPPMKWTMAMVIGLFTAILHVIICHFDGNPCKF